MKSVPRLPTKSNGSRSTKTLRFQTSTVMSALCRRMLHDGTTMTCFVIDISVSGAAISADTVPEIATVLAVGKAIGRVVRHFAGGFAVKFVDLHNRDSVEALVMGPIR